MTTEQVIKKAEIVNQKNWKRIQETFKMPTDKIEKEVSIGFIDSVLEQVFFKIVTQIIIKIKKGVEK